MSTTLNPAIPADVADAIFRSARGDYQDAVVRGSEPWSGAGLRGNAKKWGSKYAQSREGLLTRIRAAVAKHGWTATTDLVTSGTPKRARRELVLTAPDGQKHVW